MDEHFQAVHPNIWKLYENSHFGVFSEFLYSYFFMFERETCKHCGEKTDFLSVMRGYDTICFWCKNSILYQRCLICGCYIPFPQLDSHIVKYHGYLRDAENMYKTIRSKQSEPKNCIICGNETTFYSFGFCPLCDECCRVYSLIKVDNIYNFWVKYFGNEEKASSFLTNIGDKNYQKNQSLFDLYKYKRVVNGYSYFHVVDFFSEMISSLCKMYRINFDPDQELMISFENEKYLYEFYIPTARLAIDLINWNESPRVTAPNAILKNKKTLDEMMEFREKIYEETNNLGISVLVVSEPSFFLDPKRVLFCLERLIISNKLDLVKFV